MDSRPYNFLRAVLGEEGATAIRKAVSTSPTFEHAVLPRTILGWLELADSFDYEGEIPGCADTYLAFSKSEGGFSGIVRLNNLDYQFEDASVVHVAASVAVSLGADPEQVAAGVRDLDIARLGKSIDLLIKARVAAEELAKAANKGAASKESKGKHAEPREPIEQAPHTAEQPALNEKRPSRPASARKMAALTGTVASVKPTSVKMTAPHVATPPSATGKIPAPPKPATDVPEVEGVKASAIKTPEPTKAAPAGDKAAKSSTPTRVTKSQSEHRCPTCNLQQFRDDRFAGCLCFRALAKAVSATPEDGGYVLRFGPAWDREAIITLLEIFRRR